MSEAAQRMIRLVHGNLYGIQSQLLTKSHNSKSIFEWKEYLKMPSYKMKRRWKKSTKCRKSVKVGPCTKSIRNDLWYGNMIFSEESSRTIYEMGNMELIELRQTSTTIQCSSCLKHVPKGLNMCLGVWHRPILSTMDRIRAPFATLKTLYHSATVILSRGRRGGHNQWQMDHQKSHDCRWRDNKKTRIHLHAGPMAERRDIPSFSIGARLD